MTQPNPYCPPAEVPEDSKPISRLRVGIVGFISGAILPAAMGAYVLLAETYGRSGNTNANGPVAGMMLVFLISPFCGFLVSIVSRSFVSLSQAKENTSVGNRRQPHHSPISP